MRPVVGRVSDHLNLAVALKATVGRKHFRVASATLELSTVADATENQFRHSRGLKGHG